MKKRPAPTPEEPDAATDAPSEFMGDLRSPRAAERRQQFARVIDLESRIRAALPASERHLVDKLDNALGEARGLEHDDWRDRFVDGLAGHFPGVGPAIRAVAVHLDEICGFLDVDNPRAGPCGVVRAQPPDFRLEGCTGAADEDEDEGVQR